MPGPTQQSRPKPRPRRLDTRFSEAELGRVKKVAGWSGVRPSSFVREAAMEKVRAAENRPGVAPAAVVAESSLAMPPLTAQQVAELHAMRVDWKRLHSNVNQLARNSHRGRVDLEELGVVVDELADQIAVVLELLGARARP